MKTESGLSAGMQWLGVSYTVTRRHRRSGHLFEGRFKAILVEFDAWGAELSRYLHLNPMRTRKYGLEKKARAAARTGLGERTTPEAVHERLRALGSYPWSSYRNYVRGRTPSWLLTPGRPLTPRDSDFRPPSCHEADERTSNVSMICGVKVLGRERA